MKKGQNSNNKLANMLSAVFMAIVIMVVSVATVPVLSDYADAASGRKVKLNKSSLVLVKGVAYTDLELKNANGSVTFKSDKTSVAKVNKRTGKITPRKAGTCVITAKNKGKIYSCKVTVVNAKLSRKTASLTAGKTLKLKVTFPDKSRKVKWSSDNKAVATVSSKGKISAKGEGNCRIIATVGNSKMICQVRVNAKGGSNPATPTPPSAPNTPVNTDVSVSPTSSTLSVGQTLQLTTTGTPMTYGTDNGEIATVTDSGLITATGVGTVNIGATFSVNNMFVTKTCTVTVTDAQMEQAKRRLSALITVAEGEAYSFENIEWHYYTYTLNPGISTAKAALTNSKSSAQLDSATATLQTILDNAITCEPQLVYYPEASKAAFDAINEWRKTHYLYFDSNNVCQLGTCEEGSSLAPPQITWGDKVSERGRIQAGYNTYHLVTRMMNGSTWNLQNLASHGTIMCGQGQGISSTYAYIGSDETLIAEEVKRRALIAVQDWINSGSHVAAIAEDSYKNPYGSVSVCSYNKRNGQIYISITIIRETHIKNMYWKPHSLTD